MMAGAIFLQPFLFYQIAMKVQRLIGDHILNKTNCTSLQIGYTQVFPQPTF